MKLDDQYWTERYKKNATGWDIGAISTPLKEYFDQLTNKELAILIPGCGNCYEAEYLLQNGFLDITLIDISTVLCNWLTEKLNSYLTKGLKIICADFFSHEGQYDLIIEQTFFCALEPALRKSYVEKMYQLLNPGGKLVGVLFNRSFEGGPPFGGDKNEYRQLFQLQFKMAIMETCYNSIPARKDTELFIKMVKK